MEHNCLDCKFEPDWSEFGSGEYGTSHGECKYVIGEVKLPACVTNYASIKKRSVRRYKDNSGVHSCCKVWEPKE